MDTGEPRKWRLVSKSTDFDETTVHRSPRLTAETRVLNSPGPFVGLLAQLVEQRTFKPQQDAPTQGFLNRFAAERSQRRPQNGIE
jgi:hypothetical protein